MLRIGIIGARGYTGEELLSILVNHKGVKVTYLTARVDTPTPISEICPKFKGKLALVCKNFDKDEALKGADLFFLALPHTTSQGVVPLLLGGGKKVIDLSADYRLKDYKLYEKWYKEKHQDKKNLEISVYGLPELYSAKIKNSDFIANPGCYPTAAILALAPLIKVNLLKQEKVIIDAKSGYSGAGRKQADDPFWLELKENLMAYKVDKHQHSPEIEQELSRITKKKIAITFVPHLLPIERGILETIYVGITQKIASSKLIGVYKKFYQGKPFVRIKKEGEFPQLKYVRNTNFCDIGFKLGEDKKSVVIVSAIDNLVKGAAGQAVQNMNLMCGFKETEGLL